MTNEEALQLFRQTGALLEGHFLLRSGLHSRQFFQCALALQQMPIVEKFGAALAAKVRPLGAVTVVAPAMGGLVIGQEVARQLGLRFIFDGTLNLGAPTHSLIKLHVEAFPADNLPPDLVKTPAVKPGSK